VQALVEPLPSGCVEVVAVMLKRSLPRLCVSVEFFAISLRFVVRVAHHVTGLVEANGEIARVGNLPDADGFLFAIRPIGP